MEKARKKERKENSETGISNFLHLEFVKFKRIIMLSREREKERKEKKMSFFMRWVYRSLFFLDHLVDIKTAKHDLLTRLRSQDTKCDEMYFFLFWDGALPMPSIRWGFFLAFLKKHTWIEIENIKKGLDLVMYVG